MKQYNCSICGAGCYSADETKTICAECVTDKNLVEVVRCKDCKFVDTEFCPTSHYMNGICEYKTYYGMDICSYGERREVG